MVLVFPKYGYSIKKFKHYNLGYPFNVTETKDIIKQLASAIAYIHSQGYIHTDIKSDNIILVDNATNEEDGRLKTVKVKLIDFGSIYKEKDLLIGNETITSHPYRPPEVILGLNWSYPADIWSIATVLHLLEPKTPVENRRPGRYQKWSDKPSGSHQVRPAAA